MPKIKKLTKGFTAKKDDKVFELKTEVYELGFYILTFENGKLLDQTARKNLHKAILLIDEFKHKLEKRKYIIQNSTQCHNVVYNEKTLKFQISI